MKEREFEYEEYFDCRGFSGNYRFNKKSPEEIAHKLEKEIKEELEDENDSDCEEPELDA